MISVLDKIRASMSKTFYGWWVVASGSLLAAVGTGSVYYGFNTFFNPMINEFGWSRTVTSGAFSLSRLEGGIEGLIIGPLIDRFGASKIAIFGVTLTGLGFIALLLVNGNVLSLYIIFGIVLSMGYNAFAVRATYAAVAKWFTKRRGRASAFVAAGAGIGGAIMVPFLAWLITQYGWRTAAVVAGLITLLLGLPAAIAMRSTPEEKGLKPDGEVAPKIDRAVINSQSNGSKDTRSTNVDFTLSEAIRTSAFWVYTLGMTLRSCVISGIVVHEIPYLTDMGIDYTAAAGILGMMVLLSVPGRLTFGWLGDVFDSRHVLFVTCVLQAIGIWILINATNLTMVYAFVVVYGLGYGGAVPLIQSIRGELFGRKAFATITGVNNVFTTIGTIAAPVVAGYLYDIYNSYIIAFYGLMVITAFAGIAFLIIRRPIARVVTI